MTVQVGVGCLVTKDSKLLLLRRQNVHGSGTWSTPGGHMEFGESFEDCAIRETLEETGVIVDQVGFASVTNDYLPEDAKHYITIWMKARYVSGEPKISAEYEMSEVGWFGVDDFPSPLFRCFSNYLAKEGYPKSEK